MLQPPGYLGVAHVHAGKPPSLGGARTVGYNVGHDDAFVHQLGDIAGVHGAGAAQLINGELRVGIIPTLAPYLLPLFIKLFTKKYPHVKLMVAELTTDSILSKLKDGKVDVGILVTPLNETGIKEEPLFYEEMVAYVSKTNSVYKKMYMMPKDIDPTKLWLLDEGQYWYCPQQIEQNCL